MALLLFRKKDRAKPADCMTNHLVQALVEVAKREKDI